MVYRCTSSYTDSLISRIYKEAGYERRLSGMVSCYRRLLDTRFLKDDDVKAYMKADIDISCIDVSFEKASFIRRTQYWLTDLNFDVRARQTDRNPSFRVFPGWHYAELFAARPQDWPI